VLRFALFSGIFVKKVIHVGVFVGKFRVGFL
jgi:hypothetical protein